jgi:glucose/arabinose dehydrogenase
VLAQLEGMTRLLLCCVAVLPLAAGITAQERTAPTTITAHVVKPEKLAVDDRRVKLTVPPGFEVAKFAEGLGKPRILAVADDRTVYVTRRESGDVLMLRDADGDGKAEPPVTVARRPQIHGIAIDGSRVYLVTVKELFVANRNDDGTLGPLNRLIDDLPDAGQHADRTIVAGPDGMLYLSVGSTCNACDESNPENATILRVKPDGRSRTVFAAGLRNTIGFAFHPTTNELFGFDHGIDWLGDDEQGEELNQIVKGHQYGWPYIYAKNQKNPQNEPPGSITMDQWVRMSDAPLLLYTAHAAPMQFAFITSTRFPAAYRGSALVAMHGSWNRLPPSGYEVVRVQFDGGGKPTTIEPFMSGFLVSLGPNRWGFSGRPFGLAMTPDGAVLVGDDANGVIYRVVYKQRPAS